MSKPDMLLWLDDNRGIYIPRDFALCFIDRDSCVSGVSADDWADLENPESESYWDTWDSVCNNARVTMDGVVYFLNQDGPLWLIPEGMEYSEESDSWEWPSEEEEESD